MQDLAEKLMALLLERRLLLVTAESCTGGLLAGILTQKPGASKIFERGFITYSNESKMELLGVSPEILKTDGAVSARTAEAMALGALKNSRADLSISITGIAGPDGGNEQKPVGLVYFGHAVKNGSSGSAGHRFKGARQEIQAQAAHEALRYLLGVMEKS